MSKYQKYQNKKIKKNTNTLLTFKFFVFQETQNLLKGSTAGKGAEKK